MAQIKKRTPQQVGRYARSSGHQWERDVVNLWKARFCDRPWAERVRRTDQGHRAHLCDVHGVPGLWQECGKGAAANPVKKLNQAIEDAKKAGFDQCIPVAVLRPKRGRYEVWLRLSDLISMTSSRKFRPSSLYVKRTVCLSLSDFMDVYDAQDLDVLMTQTPLPKE